MRTLTMTALLLALLVNSLQASTTKSLKEIRAKSQQGLELSQEEIKLLSSNQENYVDELGLPEQAYYNEPQIGPSLPQDMQDSVTNSEGSEETIFVINNLDEEVDELASDVSVNQPVQETETKEVVVQDNKSKEETSFFDKAKALILGPPLMVAKDIVDKVKEVNQARTNANNLIKEQVKSNIRTSLGYIVDNYNTIQAVAKEYADLNSATKSLNDFRMRLNKAGIKLVLLSNPVIVSLYQRYIAEKPASQTDRELAAKEDEIKTVITDEDFKEVSASIAHLSKQELYGAIMDQEIRLANKNITIPTKLSDIGSEATMEQLEKIYFENAKLLGLDIQEIAQQNSITEESEDSYSDDNTSDSQDSATTMSDATIVTEALEDQSSTDTASCPATQTTVLSEQIAELQTSFDNFQSEQSALNSSLIQTMTMNNLLMSQNMMMMSQMMMQMQMMQMQNSIGEKKGTLTDIMDSHYKNYMTAPSYNPNAVNGTPNQSNYVPQMTPLFDPTTYQSPTFESVGPVNAMYSPGYNFSFGNIYEQPRYGYGPTQLDIDKSLQVRDIAAKQSDAWFLESDVDHYLN